MGAQVEHTSPRALEKGFLLILSPQLQPHCLAFVVLNILWGNVADQLQKYNKCWELWSHTNFGLNTDSVACPLCDLKALSVSH